jgi:hypothetical protein
VPLSLASLPALITERGGDSPVVRTKPMTCPGCQGRHHRVCEGRLAIAPRGRRLGSAGYRFNSFGEFVTGVPTVNQIRWYRRCSAPRVGVATIRACAARGAGASLLPAVLAEYVRYFNSIAGAHTARPTVPGLKRRSLLREPSGKIDGRRAHARDVAPVERGLQALILTRAGAAADEGIFQPAGDAAAEFRWGSCWPAGTVLDGRRCSRSDRVGWRQTR